MRYCIGVDLGGTNIAVGLVNMDSKKILRSKSVKTNAPRSCRSISEDIAQLCRELCADEGIEFSAVKWIGIATPGIVKESVVVGATNLGWENEPFGKIVSELTGKQTFVANDANAAAYAEALWGVGAGSMSLIAVTLGTGVGGGIVIDGKIWEGINGFAAEIGHMIIDADGRLCGCGKRGCLEAYCSASAVIKEARRMMSLRPESKMWELCGGDPARMNGKIPFEAAAACDYAAREVVNDFINYLAIGVSNIVNTFQPDVICIGGGLSGEGDALMIPLRERLKHNVFGTKDSRTRIEIAKYQNDAGIIGAALLGMQEELVEMKSQIELITENFRIEGEFVSAEPYGNGHINDTRIIKTKSGDRDISYILQKINKNVFKNPAELMENYVGVTDFIREKVIERGGDPEREVINVIKTVDGKDFYCDENGEFWRMLVFITDNVSYDRVESPEQFYVCAVAFGNFQYLLRDYPAKTLHETIPNFHNTPDRFRQLKEAAQKDACGRLSEVGAELAFAKEREHFAGTFERAFAEGKLPLRVTHNDTKLNNILFDARTGDALCVVDLDTIMPGYAMNDFGDSIRFGATTAAEDEADLSKVNFDINLFELYAKGFIKGVNGGLTETELDFLPESAIMMTFECGMRFLADYLNGDTYFKIHRPKQNLDRARNQFKLVSDMEKVLPEMHKIIDKYKESKNA